ncbi:hypothetical protein EYZ11_007879 [Aspergillus tanneri]|uniref:2,5-diamino-6-ribosylamino-4(3H)-pyrimidinone 5'-phosphate reductase n=1 Tax=Aspergillus tanneri TaxID=1220188 RepID=A0A4S3JBW5_9EURO|nr:uncharacterized protein ATNIH1004_001338 [Aspergillus tanneri]KAA8652434.1 hypothetical protein ATNIH1004_001338 [Aspergillus tanneri]THC92649.1 hypothetical protein EYZ11_007879 [Aspergillus tanneri]
MAPSRSWTGRVFIAASLDGYIARPDGDIEWLINPAPDPNHLRPSDPRTVDDFDQHMARVDCLLMGRRSYEKVISFPEWLYGTKRTFVLSTTLPTGTCSHDSATVEVIPSLDEAAEVFERERIRCVYIDGGEVVQEFLRRGWVDEIILTHVPVLLGSGIPLFGYLSQYVRMTLLAVDVIENGMVSAHYRVLSSPDGV